MEFIIELFIELIFCTVLQTLGALIRWPFLYKKRTITSILEDNYRNRIVSGLFFGIVILLTTTLL